MSVCLSLYARLSVRLSFRIICLTVHMTINISRLSEAVIYEL